MNKKKAVDVKRVTKDVALLGRKSLLTRLFLLLIKNPIYAPSRADVATEADRTWWTDTKYKAFEREGIVDAVASERIQQAHTLPTDTR